jgi:hypothetical protein
MFKHCTFYSIIIQTSSNNQIPLQIHHYLNTHTLRGDTLPALTQLLQLSAPTNIVQMPLKIIDFIPCLPFSSSSMSHCIWHVHWTATYTLILHQMERYILQFHVLLIFIFSFPHFTPTNKCLKFLWKNFNTKLFRISFFTGVTLVV